MDWKIKQKLKLPWIPFFRHPHFTYEFPKIDFSKEEDRLLTFFIFLFVVSILSAGWIYLVVELPPPLLQANKNVGLISNQSGLPYGGQTILEGIIVATLYMIGTTGFFLVRRSNRLITERYKSVIWFYTGYTLVIIAIIGFLFLLGQKG